MSAPSKLVSFDTETHLFRPGEMAPPVVCGSSAKLVDGNIVGELLVNGETEKRFEEYLSEEFMVAYANAAYDLAVMANARPELLPKIFKALEEGRVYDVLIAEALNAIYHGHLNVNPANGQGLRSPSTGKVSKRYSLEIVTHLNLGRIDAKANDVWRKSYALLEGIPVEHWPATAREYPIDDAKNTIEVALKQMETHENLDNLAAQVEAAFALHLGAAWGLRTDKDRIEKLTATIEAKHKITVERFQKKGWIRADGTEDQVAVKRAVAVAYGASGRCPRCAGSGQIKKEIVKECRGPKIKNRFKGCSVIGCICEGTGKLVTYGKAQTCKASEGGCDGTGFDLLTAPLLKRTDKGGIQADRDAKMESGDDDLYDYGENESDKILTTYLPYLRQGIDHPINFNPNVLVYSGRCSYGQIHQMPREGGVRECFRARPGYVLCSTDYSAGELCSLSQVTKWYVGESKMLDLINVTGDPGSLHTLLGAQMLGISFEEMTERIKKKDKQAKDFRQASKCFHPDVEILTRRSGWVKISELTMDDEVATVVAREERPKAVERKRDAWGRFPPAGKNQQTRAEWAKGKTNISTPTTEIVWEKPLRLTTRKAVDGLLHLKNESVDLRVTPDHRMLTYGSTKMLRSVPASEFGKQRGWFNAGMWKGGACEIDERLLRLAVAAQADGVYIVKGVTQKNIKLGFSKTRKIDRLGALLRVGESKVAVVRNGKNKPTTSFKLSEELSTKVKNLLDADKTLPWWWLELTPKLREAVLDEAAFWDSHRLETGSYIFGSTIKKNIDVLQALASITNRKATQTKKDTRTVEQQKDCYKLSVKTKHDTRGENVEVTKLDYTGDVFCLTVSSDLVLVRDGGIPIVTHQCSNFGFPGGLGPATLVITNRRKSVGSTTALDGMEYAGIRFCILIGGAEKCGVEKITEWNRRPCAPVCKACVEIVDSVLKPTFFKSYPEVKEYLNIISEMTKDEEPIPCNAWNAERGEIETLRYRGRCGYTDGANQGFQGLLSDIGKRAFVRMTREGYLGVKNDGTPSPLAGCRFPVFAHDEPISELLLDTAHVSAPRIAQIMMDCGRELAPDVTWKAEPALSFHWSKSAEPAFDETGKLIPWEPKIVA